MLVRLMCLICLVLSGCAGSEPAPAPVEAPHAARPAGMSLPPAEAADLTQRALRRQLGGNVRVGYVTEILDESGHVIVTGLDTYGMRRGDRFLFLDPSRKAVAYGTVVEPSASGVTAAFDVELVEAGRAVRPGDLAAFNLSSPEDAEAGR